jgi:hypothetical protein
VQFDRAIERRATLFESQHRECVSRMSDFDTAAPRPTSSRRRFPRRKGRESSRRQEARRRHGR